jgi:hypothetical protein
MVAYLLHVLCVMSVLKLVRFITLNTGSYSLCDYDLCRIYVKREPELTSIYIILYNVTPCKLAEVLRPLQ